MVTQVYRKQRRALTGVKLEKNASVIEPDLPTQGRWMSPPTFGLLLPSSSSSLIISTVSALHYSTVTSSNDSFVFQLPLLIT